jgi:ABC-type branched-chain amino acid transport systems, ATPase component
VTALIEVDSLTVRYGQLPAVSDVSLQVAEGEILAVIGANGAGKSTLLKTLAGLLHPSVGQVRFDGADLRRTPAHLRPRLGISLVPEGRRLFPSLTVEENLLTGTYRGRAGPWSVGQVFELFPWMADRRRQSASQLSGGEQQSVAIGRALVSNPRLLMIDELSLGLAPALVGRIYGVLPQILAEGASILLVEQDVSQALRVADRVHCLLEGRTALEGNPRDLGAEQIEEAYFGVRRQAPRESGSAAQVTEGEAAP